MLNVGVATITERVPTATPGDDRGEEAKLRWEWVLESGGGGRRGMRRVGGAGDGAARDRRTIDLDVAAHV